MHRSSWVVMVAAVWPALAHADAAKAQQLLKQGQALQAKEPKKAQQLLEQAVAESPKDARIHAELGYAALLAKDLVRAESATRKAIELATDPKVKAAASFNLGEILVGKGDSIGAEATRAETARLRPYSTSQLVGPFKSIDAFCTKWKARKDDDRDSFNGKDECGDIAETKLDKRAVHVVETGWNGDSQIHRTWHHAAFQLADGWWFAEVHQIDSAGGTGQGEMALELGSLRVFDLGGIHAVVIPSKMSNTDSDEKSHTVEMSNDEIAICAVGPSGRASCTAGIVVGETREVFDHGKSKQREVWAVSRTFAKGAIDLRRMMGKPPAGVVGKHALKFP